MNDHTRSLALVDTHAHLDDRQFERDVDSVLAAAARVGVRHVINIGYRPLRWHSTIALAARNSDVSFTLGLHPHHADEFSGTLLAELTILIEQHRPVALGEIGLDYYRDLTDRDAQRRAFSSQLALAARLRLPVVIHMRGEVEADLKLILDQTPVDLPCVLHSFDGSADLAAYALERGYLFGVGGLVTRTSNERLREIVQSLPLASLLLETDSPYLTPAGVTDRRNSPVNIPVIAAAVAELKGCSIDEVARETTLTAMRIFNLPVRAIEASETLVPT
jgi:TatD DNase family protein